MTKAVALLGRLVVLAAGLMLYGASMAMILRAGLGNIPWDVLHQGVADRVGLSVGTVTITVGAVVLLTWLPLRQVPGVGTVANVVVIGLSFDLVAPHLPDRPGLIVAVPLMLGGIVLNALATALYIGVRLGPGPRDGLMTGLVARSGWSVRVVRTALEVTVVAVGFALGGTLGVGTVLYAVGVGPLIWWFARLLRVDRAVSGQTDAPVPAPGGRAAAE
ncbi:YczE/YyaS/YitT family protein [Gordonia shandongensis]|uniref:membrane protein YczE n=1 Tax=Gordonia shandongensis TaxID=376351 RepID=UPI0005585904|nr:membrane protein [Gordonia shandongensis]